MQVCVTEGSACRLCVCGTCVQAAATRALQRLQDIPELKDALPASTARDLQLDPNMSPAHNSQINSSTAAPAAAAALAAAAAAGPAMHLSGAPPCMQRSPVQTAHAVGVSGGPGGGSNPGFALGSSEPQDLKQLAQVLASGNSRWLREKAAAAVEQLATDNPVACRCVCVCVCTGPAHATQSLRAWACGICRSRLEHARQHMWCSCGVLGSV